ncbi:WD40 repeat domain-containing protein [Bradyrhizobium sp. CB1015]|uniref:WD40 repeat domain-containing protein n=1 Tax=Bradyrhizobium sp. CB1015 TaxID=2976822 RepID=UPI0021A9A410|nr:WD40 repeat domain-containing protein [Bradyrhizobium sp. CB1015]UWU95347.1 WD40 repeat domain-containing protein [Bradyrhizobium sp. CB1015]
MQRLRLAAWVVAVLPSVGVAIGGPAASADEIYQMTKFTFCGVPEERGTKRVSISTAVFSEGGARVANATEGRVVRICETATGREIASLAVPSSRGGDDDLIRFVAFSPDGSRLVTASDDRMIRLWDIAGGRELAALEHPSRVASATFSSDGTRLATSTNDYVVRIFDVAAGREIAVLQPPSPVTFAVFSPDGKRLVTTCWEGTVHMWDAATGREIAIMIGHDARAIRARFSPDGARIVTASEDNTARIWDAASGRVQRVLRHKSPVRSVAFSADGMRIVTSAGKEARVFDAATGRELAVLKGHENDVTDAVFSPDGARIATASGDRSPRLWNAGGGGEIAVLKGDHWAVDTIAFGPDGQRIFAGGGGAAVMWTKLAAARLPDKIAGLWFGNFGPPNEPAEITRERCVRSPIRIGADGLIVFFEVGSSEPPQPILHLRCTSDLSCQIFAGAPDQGLEAQGTGQLEVSRDSVKLCLGGECRPIARCPALSWTEQERKSGFVKRWETGVQAPPR